MLKELLESIPRCSACPLMAENIQLGIPYISILPKTNAKVMFVGRDPSPNTAKVVGERGGKSAFINDVFGLAEEAGLPDEAVYITDLCKCHWRTSRGTPFPGTESRKPKLPEPTATICMEEWLFKEIRLLKPKLIVGFGEEVYQAFRQHISFPVKPPEKFSASVDKSEQDAENWVVQNGPMAINLDHGEYPFVPMRHAGNSGSLAKAKAGDNRFAAHLKVRDVVGQLLKIVPTLPK